jgi:hypothetical protein
MTTEPGVRRRKMAKLALTDLGRLRPLLQREVADLDRRISEILRRSRALTAEAKTLVGQAVRLQAERDKRLAVLASLDGARASTAGATEAEHVPVAEVRRRVLEFLQAPGQAGRATAVGYVARETGLHRTAVSRACKHLSKETREITESRRGWYMAQEPSAQVEGVTPESSEDGSQQQGDDEERG